MLDNAAYIIVLHFLQVQLVVDSHLNSFHRAIGIVIAFVIGVFLRVWSVLSGILYLFIFAVYPSER